MPGDIPKVSVGRQHREVVADTELRQKRIGRAGLKRRRVDIDICFSIRPPPHGRVGRATAAATRRTDRQFARGSSGRSSLAEAPAGRDRWSRALPRLRSRGPVRSVRLPQRARRAGTPATRRWCRQRGSTTRMFGLVVEPFVPFELTHQIEQALLAPSGDEFLERLGDSRFFLCARHSPLGHDRAGRDRSIDSSPRVILYTYRCTSRAGCNVASGRQSRHCKERRDEAVLSPNEVAAGGS